MSPLDLKAVTSSLSVELSLDMFFKNAKPVLYMGIDYFFLLEYVSKLILSY